MVGVVLDGEADAGHRERRATATAALPCHQVAAANTSNAYEAPNHTSSTAVLRYMRGLSRCDSPVRSK